MSTVQSAYKSDPGRRRNNEDFVDFYEPADPVERQVRGSLYIVADGVGGAARGERASQYAAKKLLYEYYQNPDSKPGELRDILVRINRDIHEYAEESERLTRMATTLVAALIINEKLIIANVGDSRAYLIRDGTATQLSRDHSIVGELVRSGELTEAQAQKSKLKNKLSRSLGGEAEVHVDIDPPIPVKPGDRILLCSDGLTRYALQEDIARLTVESSPEEIVNRLVDFSNRSGGEDNVTVMMVDYEPTEVLEPTVRLQKMPEQVTWDTMETVPEIMLPKRKVSKPARLGLWATLFFGPLIIGVIILYLFLYDYFQLPSMLQKTLYQTPTVSVTNPDFPTPPITSAVIASTIVFVPPNTLDTLSTTIAPSITLGTITLAPTAKPIDVPTTKPPEYQMKICVAEVVSNRPNLSSVVFIFQNYDPGKTYEICANLINRSRCDQRRDIMNLSNGNPNVSFGDWIIIPDVNIETCKNGGGLWIVDYSLR